MGHKKISGTGVVFLNSYGAIFEKKLAAGETYIVDAGHIVAFEESVQCLVKKAANMWAFADEGTPPYKITAIKAYLFFEQKNSFSKDVLLDPNIFLLNTNFGEGFAGSPSHATMVVVEVTGKPGSSDFSRQIVFSSVINGKVTFQKTATIKILNASGKYYEAYWLYDTGGAAVKLIAKIIGQSPESKLEKTIPFIVGE